MERIILKARKIFEEAGMTLQDVMRMRDFMSNTYTKDRGVGLLRLIRGS